MVVLTMRQRSEIVCVALWMQLEFRGHSVRLDYTSSGALLGLWLITSSTVYVQQHEGEIAKATEFLTEGSVTQQVAIAR